MHFCATPQSMLGGRKELEFDWFFNCCSSAQLQRCAQGPAPIPSEARLNVGEVRPLLPANRHSRDSRGRAPDPERHRAAPSSRHLAADQQGLDGFGRRDPPQKSLSDHGGRFGGSLQPPTASQLSAAPMMKQPLRLPGAASHGGLEESPMHTPVSPSARLQVTEAMQPQAATATALQPQQQQPRRKLSPVRGPGTKKEQASKERALWGSGTRRVLVAGISEDGGVGKHTFEEGSEKLAGWCRECGIDDVSILALSGTSFPDSGETCPDDAQQLRSALQDMSSRCQPGDTCFLHLAGLDALLATAVGAGEQADGQQVSPLAGGGEGDAGQCRQAKQPAAPICVGFLNSLPSHVTLVCVVDAPCDDDEVAVFSDAAAAVASEAEGTDRRIRIIIQSVGLAALLKSSEECESSDSAEMNARRRSSALCVAAVMRTVDALSLADGVCSLTCGDFFSEMEDQVRGLAAATRMRVPDVFMKAHPQATVAELVQWPIAARRAQMTGDSAAGVWRPTSTDTRSPPPIASAASAQQQPPRGLGGAGGGGASGQRRNSADRGSMMQHRSSLASPPSFMMAPGRSERARSATGGSMLPQPGDFRPPPGRTPPTTASSSPPPAHVHARARSSTAPLMAQAMDFGALASNPSASSSAAFPPLLRDEAAATTMTATSSAPASSSSAAPASAQAPASAPASVGAVAAPTAAAAAAAATEDHQRKQRSKEHKEQRHSGQGGAHRPGAGGGPTAAERKRSASTRAMPTGFGDLSKMLSGGGRMAQPTAGRGT
mmetsp:Transcript_70749/g.229866  ORF Transcript_70749/g.229866 Transcript_70749/m.229866 type:complete len:775 (-) Transcript_70749:32-2356(-)